MLKLNMFLSFVILQAFFSASFGGAVPDYIHVCKRDPDTISNCVRESIEHLRPKLVEGIPELNVPGIEPLIIHELVVDQGNLVQLKAVGRDVKVNGASNFKLKKLDVDLDRPEVRARIYFPRLEFDGKYDLDARLVVVAPFHGKGDIRANATKCLADVVMHIKVIEKKGVKYLKFTQVDLDIDVGDFTMEITNLFNGDVQLGDLANQLVTNNKAEFLRAIKPYVERTTSNIVKKIANRIASAYTYDDIIPLP